MKVKLRKLWDSQKAIMKVASKDLPIKLAYWVGRDVDRVERELRDINKSRVELVKKFGKEDEKKKTWTVTPENAEVFEKEFEAFLETEVEVDIKQFEIEEFSSIQLSGEECNAINFMLKQGEI